MELIIIDGRTWKHLQIVHTITSINDSYISIKTYVKNCCLSKLTKYPRDNCSCNKIGSINNYNSMSTSACNHMYTYMYTRMVLFSMKFTCALRCMLHVLTFNIFLRNESMHYSFIFRKNVMCQRNYSEQLNTQCRPLFFTPCTKLDHLIIEIILLFQLFSILQFVINVI